MENNHFQERKDQLQSAVITLIISLLVLLFIYFCQFTRIREKQEVVTTMLINFSENTEIQQSIKENTTLQHSEPTSQKSVEQVPQPESVAPTQSEKIITGNAVFKVKKNEEPKPQKKEIKAPQSIVKEEKNKQLNKETSQSITQNKAIKTPSIKPTTETTNTINNLLNNRGKKGNENNQNSDSGDPIGGRSNGNSKIGVDRKLIAFIPGTMGKGGTQPSHNCTASGSITIAYIVDKNGNVSSAHRVSGSNDACIVRTTTAWVKKYVKAEKADGNSSGNYTIIF